MILIHPAVGIILSFIFGSLIGSFLNVLIWRLPREESIGGRSHCPKCGHGLIWIDLIPVISILLFRAKCRYCKARISLRYPVIELITAVLFTFAWTEFTPHDFVSGLLLVKALILIAVCVVVFVIDLEHYLILDKIVFPTGVIMGLFALLLHSYSNFFAAIVFFIPFWFLSCIYLDEDRKGSKLFPALTFSFKALDKPGVMGFGDAKFVALMGLALGFTGTGVGLFLAFFIGAIVGVLLILLGNKKLGSKLPFGTFLSVATILGLFWGQKLWDLYWTLL